MIDMKNRISLAALIVELGKYGVLEFSKFDYSYNVYKEYEDVSCFLTVMQENTKSVRSFCETAAGAFEEGVSEMFDKIWS